MITHRTLPAALLAVLALSVAGCANKKNKNLSGADGDYVSGSALPEREEGVSFLGNNVDRNQFSPVRFGFDSYAIAPNETGKLDQVAEFMRSGSPTLIIAGFTDERGTPEYNRGLGERRAQAVRDYLLSHGAPGRKIQTVSFGADMPADAGSGEGAWAKNRRAEFGIVR